MVQDLTQHMKYLQSSDPLCRIDREHLRDQMVSFFEGVNVMNRIICMVDFPIQFLIRVAFVGEVPNQHDEHHHPQGPDIRSFPPVLQLLDYFRCHVTGRATEDLDLHSQMKYLSMFLDACTEPEIYQFHLHLIVYYYILQFYIPVGHVLAVQVLQSSSHLPHYVLAHVFRKSLARLLLQRSRKRYSRQVLHDDVQVVIRFDHVEDLDDVGVVQDLQDFYLSTDSALADGLLDLAFLVGLDGYFLVLGSEDGDPNRRIGAFTDDFANDVVLLEFDGQVALVGTGPLVLLVELVALRQSGEQLIVLILQPQELSIGKIPLVPPDELPLNISNFRPHFLFFFGAIEKLIQILFCHEVLRLGLLLQMRGLSFIELD